MGNILSSIPIIDILSSFLSDKAMYVLKLEDNLEALQSAAGNLNARSIDLRSKVEIEERKGLQPLEVVREWLSHVESVESKVRGLLITREIEVQRLCMYGYCSNNFLLTYNYGKNVTDNLERVNALLSSSESFEMVAEKVPPPHMDERPIRFTIGLERMLEKAWNRLMDADVAVLGLYGMGGVGKTTLLDQINNKFLKTNDGFDVVIWVVVSQDLQIERIQKEIGKRLCLSYDNEGWLEKTEAEKAYDIYKALKRKRFVMLLDYLWSKVSLEDIGIPLPSTENGSKIAFTTRSKKVCGRMGVDVEMEVECLESDDAWELFRKKVGKSALRSDPDIIEIARMVATKCRGLPLALNIIGETLASKRTVQEWRYALEVLDSYAAEFSEVEDEILPILKFSYDDLKSEKLKLCLLYCALYPEDYEISKDELVDKCICEGIIDKDRSRESSVNKGYEIIGTLVNVSLLMDGEEDGFVKMHDVVRQMALWISSDFGNEKENLVVKTGVQLREVPEVKEWNVMRRMSLMHNQIEDVSSSHEYPNLVTLFLQWNMLVNISSEFLRLMPNLAVLDLSYNKCLTNLPEEISYLKSLRFLNLSGTKIELLPMGLTELRKLIHLDLNTTDSLREVDVGVISSLLTLETLKLFDSALLSLTLLEGLLSLKNLKLLWVTIREVSILEHLLGVPRLASCIQGIWLDEVVASNGVSFQKVSKSLKALVIDYSNVTEIKIDWINNGVSSLSRTPTSTWFQNLDSVLITGCKGLKDVTMLLFAPSLTRFTVHGLVEMEELISQEKVIGIMNKQPNTIILFPKLKQFDLSQLKKLKSIYWSPLPFPFLKQLVIIDCPLLRRLPFNSESAKGNPLHVIINTEEWLQRVQWEDEATKDRFFRSFTVQRP